MLDPAALTCPAAWAPGAATSPSGGRRTRYAGLRGPVKRYLASNPEARPEPLARRLRALHPGASGRRVKRWLHAGRVRVNGAVVRRGDVPVAPGDQVVLGAPEVAFPAALRLIHEDARILVVDKPPGLLTIATPRERGTTAYRLLRDWAQARSGGSRNQGLFVVHRLDRETSGLLVFARTGAAKRALQAQFRARRPERVYVACVKGGWSRPKER